MNRSGLAPSIIRAGHIAPGRRWEASKIFHGAFTLPLLNSLDQIVDKENADDLKTIELGRDARQASTDVRTGHGG